MFILEIRVVENKTEEFDMGKYVAFLDILGFKKKLKKFSQEDAKSFIEHFSMTAFAQWKAINPSLVTGYIVSDSFILYSQDTSTQSISQLLTLVERICQQEFSANGILIRGAIAKGEFDRIEAREIPSLRKELIVGQAYVDAYLTEASIKTAGIALTNEVFQDIEAYALTIDCFRENVNGKDICVMRYFNFDFLNEPENIISFTNLALSAGWLPHYYNTLYWALMNEKPNKAMTLFNSIVNCINNGNPGENWRSLDEFIKGAFNGEVNSHFQTRFLAFLRSYVIPANSDKVIQSKRTGNKERVLQYIDSCGNATLMQISLDTGLSRATISRIVKDLVKDGRVMITHNGRAQTYSVVVDNKNAK